jgi:hypothetical protein
MSQFWEGVVERSKKQATVADLEAAAYRLVTEQVIYYSERNSRTAFWLIEQYERDFRTALAPLGIQVEVNRKYRYAFARPMHEKTGAASMAQTLFALVLRLMYDEGVNAGRLTGEGTMVYELLEVQERYRLATGDDLPSKGELEALMRTMRRWGLARKVDAEVLDPDAPIGPDQPYAVEILPAVVDLLGETALIRLAQWKSLDPAVSAEVKKLDVDDAGPDQTQDE